MIRILFVCHGNICRSPMAEFVFKDMVKRAGIQDKFYVKSAAATSEEIGNGVHRGTVKKLMQEGVEMYHRQAWMIKRETYEQYDRIIAMDNENIRDMLRIFGGDPQGKIQLLMSLCGENREVADPWYTGNFDKTYEDIKQGCAALLKELIQ